MKLLRYGPPGQEKPGLLDAEGRIRDLSAIIPDIGGEVLSPAGLDRLRAVDIAGLPFVEGNPRLGPCVGDVPKIVCVGLNYVDHARETGATPPPEPILFFKATSALCGPDDDTIMPRGSTKTDWEVELAVVIGTRARYVEEDRALRHVAGYCVMNDVSERQDQLERGGQWVKGKSADTFAPLGPWLVTADEVPDPQNLPLWCEVNGKRLQNGTTADMIFNVACLVSYISRFMTLMPGDVIATGTPFGVGLGLTPPTFLKAGDRVELGIEGMGVQRQNVVAWEDAR